VLEKSPISQQGQAFGGAWVANISGGIYFIAQVDEAPAQGSNAMRRKDLLRTTPDEL
jgi:hypothetical protein